MDDLFWDGYGNTPGKDTINTPTQIQVYEQETLTKRCIAELKMDETSACDARDERRIKYEGIKKEKTLLETVFQSARLYIGGC